MVKGYVKNVVNQVIIKKTCKNPPKIDTNINSVSEEELSIEEDCEFVDEETENEEIYEEVSDSE